MKSGIFEGASALAVTLVLATSAAQAQEATVPEENGGLAEIVVTAQKRSESAQQVPIAISAVTAEALQSKGLTDIASISGQAPNVTLKSSGVFGGSSSTLFTYIRGIGQNDFGFNLEPGVGVYVDGVYLARNIGANVDLLDLQRVEVLKGPQGTLFGRNTIGGGLNIVTADPGDEWKVKGEVTTGRYHRIDVRGSLEAPLAQDVLRLGLAFSTKHRDGWQKRIPYSGDTGNNPIWLLATDGASGGPANTNTDEAQLFPLTANITGGDRSGSQNQTAFRAKLLFTPNDRLTVRLIGDYLHVNEQATPFSLLQVDQNAYVALYNTCISGNPAFYAPVAALAGVPAAGVNALCTNTRGNPGSPAGTQPSLQSQAGRHLPYDSRYVIRNADGSINPNLSYASGANYNKINNYGINGQLEYEFADNLTVRSITAYRRLQSNFGVDIGGAPFSALSPTFADRENQFSEELQLLGNLFQDRWKYVLGAYYFHEYGTHDDAVPFTGGLIQINSPNNRYDTKSYAAFMHNNIEVIPEKLGLTLGIRYTHDRKTFTGTQRDENAFGLQLLQLPAALVSPNPADPYLLYPLGRNRQSFDNISYRIGAEYHLDRRMMVYASYATGYKGGGWTTRLTLPNFTTDASGAIVKLPAPTFGPEKAYTTEIGFKSELFGRRARLNVALFNTEYNSIQLTFQNGSSPVTANGGDGRIRGAEAELNLAPVRNWNLDASIGYIDAKYQSVLPGVPLTGSERFVNTPKWQAQAGTAYTLEIGGLGSITPRVDWTYSSRTFNDEANTGLLATPSGSFFNGSVTWRPADERFELQAGMTNIGNRRVVVSGYTNAEAIYSGVFSRPREWFLTLRVHD